MFQLTVMFSRLFTVMKQIIHSLRVIFKELQGNLEQNSQIFSLLNILWAEIKQSSIKALALRTQLLKESPYDSVGGKKYTEKTHFWEKKRQKSKYNRKRAHWE